jgi:hypothetical protein
LIWGIDIQESGGVFYVLIWERGRYKPEYGCYYHDWKFTSKEQVFEYIDWCEVYCDRVLHDLLVEK